MPIDNDFTDHTVVIYNEYGDKITETTIVEYDIIIGSIRIKEDLKLTTGINVQLLILTSPSPCFFLGRIGPRIQNMITIDLHSGKSKEDRTFERFSIDLINSIESTGTINSIIRENVKIDAPPQKVQLINISHGGIRFSGASGILHKNDEIILTIKNSNADQILTAKVVNFLNAPLGRTEYGCQFSNVSSDIS